MLAYLRSMNKKVLALLLAAILLLSALPALMAVSTSDQVNLYENGQKVTTVNIGQTTPTSVFAVATFGEEENVTYAWQVLANADANVWVNIEDKTDKELLLNYALVVNVLDENDCAYVRCVVSAADGSASAVSYALTVRVLPTIDESLFPTAEVPRAATPAVEHEYVLGGTQRTYYYITVKYVYYTEKDEHIDGTAAFHPYVATIAAGDNFNLDVNCPALPGFTSWVQYEEGEEFVAATNTKRSYTNISESHTVTVQYRPAETTYDVRIYLQNTQNDEYTENTSWRTKYTGYTLDDTDNEKIKSDFAARTQGFQAVPTDPLQIAGDGSTELHQHYDREYYLMFFELGDGGFGTDAVYAKYDADVRVKDPTRPGYVFRGWSSKPDSTETDIYTERTGDTNQYTAMKVPIATTAAQEGNVASTTYYAVWDVTETNYTVIYWLENADNNSYSYGGSVKAAAVSGTVASSDNAPKYAGADASQFTYFPARSDQSKIVNGDGSTVLNVFYLRKTYTLTFYVSGKTYTKHTHDALTAATTNNFTAEKTTNGCYIRDCNKAGHVHTEDCKVCGFDSDHVHTNACCAYTADPSHTAHTKSCYTVTVTYTNGGNTQSFTLPQNTSTVRNPTAGSNNVYRTTGWNSNYTYYYYYAGDTYYSSGYYQIDATIGANLYSNNYRNARATSAKTCGKHIHGVDSCDYSQCKEHVHTAECYDCGFEGHVHSADCYRLVCNKVTKTSASDSATLSNTLDAYNLKYGQNSSIVWDQYAHEYLWATTNGGQTCYSSAPTITGNLTVYGGNKDSQSCTIHYTENGTNKTLLPDFVINKNLTSGLTEEDYIAIPGFTYDRNETITRLREYRLWYDRNSYTIDYYDGHAKKIRTVSVPFETSLADYMAYTPTDADYPAELEQGIYKFGGWYLDESLDESTRFSPDNPLVDQTMPYHDIVLYAKWVPITHEVKFYTDAEFKTLITEDGRGAYTQPGPVDHNAYLTNIPQDLSKDGYLLAGWFFYDGSTKTAFDPFNMRITKDMNLFPEWQTTLMVNYEIRYELEDGTTLAKPLTGSMLAGNSRMFYAKGEPDWYEPYKSNQDHYFPLIATHNMVMSTNPEDNIFTFIYQKKDSVSYSVKYVDNQGKPMVNAEGKSLDYTASTTDTVIDVTPAVFQGYLPDAFSKRVVLSLDDEENVVTFVYTPNTVDAYYRVSYLYQDTVEDNYVEMRSIDYLGLIDDEIDTDQLIADGLYEGFEFDPDNSTDFDEPIVVSKDGVHITISYVRKICQYTVYHRVVGTTTDLIPPVTGTARYGANVTVSAVNTIPDVSPVGTASSTIDMALDPSLNVCTFYYSESQIQFVYQRIVPDYENGGYKTVPAEEEFDGGILSMSADFATAYTGNPAGSKVLEVGDNYQFKGWYVLDENGTISVLYDGETVKARPVNPATDNATLSGDGLTVTPKKNDGIFVKGVYFALFQPLNTTLTITRSDLTAGDEMIYHIVGKSDYTEDKVDLYVTVNSENPSVTVTDLPIGDYTVTEEHGWSWRYAEYKKTGKITPATNELLIEGKRGSNSWITEVLNKVNDFIGKQEG